MNTQQTEWSIMELIDWTTNFFKTKNIPDPRLDAEVLLANTLGIKRLDMYVQFERPVSEEERSKFRELVKKRAARTPVAYITGEREFMGIPFSVNEHVLIPRPETELIVENALSILKDHNTEQERIVVDTFTGTGNIPISIAKHASNPNTQIFAIDIKHETLECAQNNAVKSGVAQQVRFLNGDVLAPLCAFPVKGQVDIITANPPYIASHEFDELQPEVLQEPRHALHGGKDGVMFYEKLIRDSSIYLKPEGTLLMEISPLVKKSVEEFLLKYDFNDITTIKDYSGLDRIIIARRKNG